MAESGLASNRPQAVPKGVERRRHPRRRIEGVVGTQKSPGDITVLDLSVEGLAAEAIGDISPGQHCFLELVHQRHRIHVEVLVRWASVTRVERGNDRFIPVFRAGFSFVDIDRDDDSGIWNWILPASAESA